MPHPAFAPGAQAGDDHRGYRTKPEIAVAEIDRARTAGLRFGYVLADAGYGLFAPFRQASSERGLFWAVGVGVRQKVHPVDVALIPGNDAAETRTRIDLDQTRLDSRGEFRIGEGFIDTIRYWAGGLGLPP